MYIKHTYLVQNKLATYFFGYFMVVHPLDTKGFAMV